MTIEIINAKGHREQVPLWQLPMHVQNSINAEKGQIEARKANEKADAELAQMQEQERQRQQQQLADGLNAPMDLSVPVQF